MPKAVQAIKPESYFLKYAFPCAEVLKDLRRITEKDFEKAKKAAFSNKTLPKRYLEKIFKNAVIRMKKIDKNCWNIATIRKYFLDEHNKVIDREEGEYKRLPEAIKQLCRIKTGKVIEIKKGILITKVKNEKINLVPLYKNPKKGDKVIIHYGFAVEKA